MLNMAQKIFHTKSCVFTKRNMRRQRETEEKQRDEDTEKRDKRETDRPKETQAYRRAKTETSKTE